MSIDLNYSNLVNVKTMFKEFSCDENSLSTLRKYFIHYDLAEYTNNDTIKIETINDFIHYYFLSTRGNNTGAYTNEFLVNCKKLFKHKVINSIKNKYIKLLKWLCSQPALEASILNDEVAFVFKDMCFGVIDKHEDINSSNSNPLASFQPNSSNTPTDSLDVIRAALAKFL